MMSRQLPASLLLLTCGLAALPACGGDDGGGSGDATATGTDPDTTAGTQGMTSSVTMDDSATLTDPDTTMDPSETMDPTEDTVDPDTSTGDVPGTVDAFRFTSLNVRDPHFFVDAPLVGCIDATDSVPLGDSVNEQFNAAIAADDPAMPDGALDLSLMLLFRPLDQTDGAAGDMDFANGTCLVPAEATVCDLREGTEFNPTGFSSAAAGTCLEPDAAHLSSENYNPQPGTTSGPCFHAGPGNVTIQTSFALELQDAEIAGQYVGDPADEFVQGTLRGFMPIAVAEATMLPPDLVESTGATTIAQLLPGGTGNCADHSDLDGDGWWFYADFTAQRVPWNGN
jgi:hypothetical protein